MSQFLNRRVRLVNCLDAGKEGTTISMHQKNGIPWIKVKLDNGREVGISDPSTLWFLIERKEGVAAEDSGRSTAPAGETPSVRLRPNAIL